IDLNTLLAKVLADMDILIQEKKAILSYDKLPVINGIRVQLFQLFQNIINNGIKFSQENINPKIEIAYKLIAAKDVFSHEPFDISAKQYHQITFTDNGIGFDESYLPKVFVIFERLHGRSEFKGTGIGMAVCKKIVEN